MLFFLKVRNIREHEDFYEHTRNLSNNQKYDYYYKVMVSSNMRRMIEYAKDLTLSQMDSISLAMAL